MLVYFFFLAVGVICKSCTYLYASKELFCRFFILKSNSLARLAMRRLAWQVRPRGRCRRKSKGSSGLEWMHNLLAKGFTNRGLSHQPLGPEHSSFFQLLEDNAENAKSLSLASHAIASNQWHCHSRQGAPGSFHWHHCKPEANPRKEWRVRKEHKNQAKRLLMRASTLAYPLSDFIPGSFPLDLYPSTACPCLSPLRGRILMPLLGEASHCGHQQLHWEKPTGKPLALQMSEV